MAAALAKVVRGGRSGASSAPIAAICRRGLQEGGGGAALPPTAASAPIPAFCRRGLQEGVAGSSPASPAAGMSRLMHTGQWRNSLPQKKTLPLSCRLMNYRTTCNLPRMGDGIKGLKQKYMRVPRYEMYGSEFSILYIWDQLNNVGKLINIYKRSSAYPLAIAFLLIFSGACILDGYSDYTKNEKILADIRGNTKKAAATVEGTKQILQELESQISYQEGICKGKR